MPQTEGYSMREYKRSVVEGWVTNKLRRECRHKCQYLGVPRTWVNDCSKEDKVEFLVNSTVPEQAPHDDKPTEEAKITIGGSNDTARDSLTDMLVDLVSKELGNKVDGIIKDAVSTTETTLTEAFATESKNTIKKVDERIATLRRPVQVVINDVPVTKVEDMVHESYTDALECLQHFGKVWLCGHSGTGKSVMLEQCANALGFSKEAGTYTYVKGSAGVTESHLTGRMTFDGEYIDGLVSHAFRNGSFLCLDEFDGFDANCGFVFNSIFDGQGILSTPNDREHPMVLKSDGFTVGVASNTWGNGQDFNYVGRGQLDLATLDRLQAVKVWVDYDKNIERALAGDYVETANMLWDLRSRVHSNSINRIISTRLFVDGQKWRKVGKGNAKILDKITVDWTAEEKSKVNVSELKGIHK